MNTATARRTVTAFKDAFFEAVFETHFRDYPDVMTDYEFERELKRYHAGCQSLDIQYPLPAQRTIGKLYSEYAERACADRTYHLSWAREDGQGAMQMGDFDRYQAALDAIPAALADALGQCADDEQREAIRASDFIVQVRDAAGEYLRTVTVPKDFWAAA